MAEKYLTQKNEMSGVIQEQWEKNKILLMELETCWKEIENLN